MLGDDEAPTQPTSRVPEVGCWIAAPEWARLLLATGMIDLSSLEDDPRGEALLDALWDAAEGVGLSESQLEVARVVAAEGA